MKSRRLTAPLKDQKSRSVSCQTLEDDLAQENEELKEKINLDFRSKQRIAIDLQYEKEINGLLVNTLNEVFDLADDNIKKNKSRSKALEITHDEAAKSVLKSPTDIDHFHAKINRDLKTKVLIANSNQKVLARIHNECKDTVATLKLRQKEFTKPKHPWSAKTGSCVTISQSSSNCSKKSSFKLGRNTIRGQNILSDARIPVTPEDKSLRHSKSVHFSIPLRSVQSSSQINNNSGKIEIEIPSNEPFPTVTITATPQNTQVTQKIETDINKFRKVNTDHIDFNLLNVSQSSSNASQRELSLKTTFRNRKETKACMARSKVLVAEIDVLNKQWKEFAGTRDDDFELFDYSSDDDIKQDYSDSELFNYESDEDTTKK